jgi:hypothetical protein
MSVGTIRCMLTVYSLPVALLTTRFNIQKFCMLITLHLCVLYVAKTVTFTLYSINRLVFITEVGSVYCAVRTESSYVTGTPRTERVNVGTEYLPCV